MKKRLRRIFCCVIALIMTGSLVLPAYAIQPEGSDVMPLYNTYIKTTYAADIDDNLNLTTYASYTATSSVTRVDITTYVEKRNLLVFWEKVEIGQPNNEWTDICYGTNNYAYHSKQLSNSGTYRVTMVYEVYNGTTLMETVEERSGNINC